MDRTQLGRTGFEVTRMGLGCGGHSRLGLSYGAAESEAERVVHEAIALGVNFIDTAESYGTEEVVGRAISRYPREQIVLSTKAGVHWQERLSTPSEMKFRVEECLSRLRTDYVDVFHLHGVSADDYPYARDVLAPALLELKVAGKVRAVGLTEAFASDPQHRMLNPAIHDDVWEVVMVGYNVLNPSARREILPTAIQKGIGTLCMFAVRRALSRPKVLRAVVADLIADQVVDPQAVDPENPLSFLTQAGVAASVEEAAYRFCRWSPGFDVVLSGTGNVDHLRENARALAQPALPEPIVERLLSIFGNVDSVSGN